MAAEAQPATLHPTSVAVLCNPAAGRVRKDLERVRRQGRRLAGERYREAVTPAQVTDALDSLDPTHLLVVIGGDGTLQAALSHLYPGPWPAVLPIPGGTTNMTARDLRLRGSPGALLESLARQLEANRGVSVRPRPVLCLERPGTAPVVGLFLGAGAIAAGVNYFRERVRGRLGVTGEKASALAVLRVLLPLLSGRSHGRRAPLSARLVLDGVQVHEGEQFLILVTALDRLLFGARPYWGQGPGGLRCTVVAHPPRRLLRSLPALLRGRPGRRLLPQHGYRSWNLDHLELELDGPMVVDGELYPAPEHGGALQIRAAGPVPFAGLGHAGS